MVVGELFDSFTEVRDTIRAIARTQHWEARIVDSDKTRVIIKCRRTKGCAFHVRAFWIASVKQARLSSLRDEHTCVGAPPVARSNIAKLDFLVEQVSQYLKVIMRTNTKDIQSVVAANLGGAVQLQQAQKLKRVLLHGTTDERLLDLPKYPPTFKRLRPRTLASIQQWA